MASGIVGRRGRGDGRRLRGDREHLRDPGPERLAELPVLLQGLEAAPLPLRRLLRGHLVALGLEVVVPGGRPEPPVPAGRPPLDRLEVARPLAELQPRRLVGPPRPEVAVRQEGRVGLLPLRGWRSQGSTSARTSIAIPPARAMRPVAAVRLVPVPLPIQRIGRGGPAARLESPGRLALQWGSLDVPPVAPKGGDGRRSNASRLRLDATRPLAEGRRSPRSQVSKHRMSTAGDRITQLLDEFRHSRDVMVAELGKVIVGQREVIEQILAAIFTRGHCLLVGVPGLAKTLMVSSIARILDVGFKRIQFTPDLMPSDITGTMVLDEPEAGRREFRFVQGPIFANIILADEINRTPPKTQAALLQAMQERQVTVGQETLQPARPVLRHRHAEPDRAGRHLSRCPRPSSTASCSTSRSTIPTLDEEKQILVGDDQGGDRRS